MLKKTCFALFFPLALLLAACERPSPEPAGAEAPVAETTEAVAPAESPPLILVTGATGTQGGAVARELLLRGYEVRALTRDPSSGEAQALASLGASTVQGDFNDAASLAAALEGVDGVFGVTVWWDGFDAEIEQGKRLIDEASKAGVAHFVLTSVASADENTGIPHFDSKWAIEQYLHQSDLNWSVVRPVEFMNNWYWRLDEFGAGQMADPRKPESGHQWIAASDIGFFVAEAFDHPDEWVGQTVEIAGDGMTVGELASALSDAYGHEVSHIQVSWEDFEARAGEEIALMYRWFEDVGYSADIASLRERYPDLVTVPEFLQEMATEGSPQ